MQMPLQLWMCLEVAGPIHRGCQHIMPFYKQETCLLSFICILSIPARHNYGLKSTGGPYLQLQLGFDTLCFSIEGQSLMWIFTNVLHLVQLLQFFVFSTVLVPFKPNGRSENPVDHRPVGENSLMALWHTPRAAIGSVGRTLSPCRWSQDPSFLKRVYPGLVAADMGTDQRGS